MKEAIQVKGTVRIIQDGKILVEKHNLVVDAGLNLIASRLKDTSDDALSHIAIGTSTTAPAAGQTALGAEQIRRPFSTIVVTANEIDCEIVFTSLDTDADFNWKEIGIFNAASGGTMFNRVNVDYTKDAGKEVTVKITLTFNA